jgi:hypothetical protein
MKATDWISVKDRLPKLGERVLICQNLGGGSTYVDIAQRYRTSKLLHNIDIWIDEDVWIDEDIWATADVFGIKEDVTHWQKITLPKKEKEN